MDEFSISDVAYLLGIRRLDDRKKEEFQVECPFCGDRRGKMYFCAQKGGEKKNTYCCFNCGASGNMLTLYAELKGIYGSGRYREAYKRIREELSGVERRCIAEPVKKVPQQKHMGKAGREAVDRTYRQLLAMLPLSETHKDKLRMRGLSDAQIQRLAAASVPPVWGRDQTAWLERQSCVTEGVPGFYKNRRGSWQPVFPKGGGIMFPVPDRDGLCAGIQIRMDRVVNGRKYLWFSSAGYPGGVSSGSPTAFYGDMDAGEVSITEGGLKAYCAWCFSGKSFIGIPGVRQTKGIENFLKEKAGSITVRECMDMDKLMDVTCDGDGAGCSSCHASGTGRECPEKLAKRTCIREGCNQLYRICERHGIPCKRIVWNTRSDGIWSGKEKGIDDYYLAGILQDTDNRKRGQE